MAKTIEITSFLQVGDRFQATGTCEGKAFSAQTILWGPRGEKQPIFKVFETNTDGESGRLKMTDSEFKRGERIAIARRLKVERLNRAASSDLDGLSVKALRKLCKERGVKGSHTRGVRKADIVKLLAA